MAISFENVGELVTNRKFQRQINEIPIGIKTPLDFGNKNDGIISMHFNLEDQIQDNLKNLLLTNWGERLAFYDYGANLRELTFEMATNEFDSEAMKRIKRAVLKWMPFVELQFFDKEIVGITKGQNVTQVKLKIIYDVKKIGILNKGIELTFFIGG